MFLIRAYAKINLTLNVLGTLPNGYHEVESLMQSVNLFDDVYLDVKESNSFEISLDCKGAELPENEDNLAYKAALLMHTRFHKKFNEKISISIEKRIPVAAGLAGGSSDAAAVIHGLSLLWDIDPPYDLAAELGSDVPFCLMSLNGCTAAVATGTGTQLAPAQAADYIVLLATPDIHVPTAAVYKELKEADCGKRFSIKLPEGNKKPDFGNHLEAPAIRLFPEIANTIEEIKRTDAIHVQMSGSGPTVFALFPPETRSLKCSLPENLQVHLVQTLK